MLQLAYHNSKIDQRTGEVKMIILQTQDFRISQVNRLCIGLICQAQFTLEGGSPQIWLRHTMSSVMQTCWNDLGLNLYIVSPMSCMVTILKDGLVKSYKKRSKVYCY